AVGVLVAPRMRTDAASPTTASSLAGHVPLLVAVVLVLAANVAVVGDLARLLGVTRVFGVVVTALLVLAAVARPVADLWWRFAAPVGAVIVLVPLVFVVVSSGAPWTVWREVASRPALTFDASSTWVTQGAALGDDTRLTFDEPHRVIAATPATWRVIERDAPR